MIFFAGQAAEEEEEEEDDEEDEPGDQLTAFLKRLEKTQKTSWNHFGRSFFIG